MMTRLIAVLILGTALSSVPAQAQGASTHSVPPDVQAEIARLSDLPDPEARLQGLDRLLARLDEPSPVRGYVQVLRAAELYGNTEGEGLEEAQTAIEEAMRLLPGAPLPMLLASAIYTYRGDPGRAADLWIAASKTAPELARRSEVYDLKALLERLSTDRLYDKADALLGRMVAVGHPGADTGLRTGAAAARVRTLIKAGDVAGAAEAMRQVVDFGTFLDLYTNRTYEPIWPAMERWMGGALTRQHDASLRAYRSDWRRNGLSSAAPYASALGAANADEAVVELFLPLVRQPPSDPASDPADEFYRAVLAQKVADSLLKLDRSGEAVALLSDLAEQFTPSNPASGLTARANLARAQLILGQFGDAAATVERFKRDAPTLKGTGNKSGLAETEIVGACARIAGGEPAADLLAEMQPVLMGAPKSALLLWYECLEDERSARQLVLEALANEDERSWAVGLMQPHEQDMPGEWVRQRDAFSDRIRSDPEVRATAERVGRLLPAEPGRQLPPTFDPKG